MKLCGTSNLEENNLNNSRLKDNFILKSIEIANAVFTQHFDDQNLEEHN